MEAVAPIRRADAPTTAEAGPRPPLLAVGTVLWLASELMFFSGLFAAYFTLRATAEGPWPPKDVHLETGVAALVTLVLVASSGTMQLAMRALRAGKRQRFQQWVALSMVLALVFIANQAREWATADFGASSHTFGSAFYVMTGFHGLHLIGGVIAMLVLLARAADPAFGAADAPTAEVVSYYWHFVDAVWLGLFAALFLLH